MKTVGFGTHKAIVSACPEHMFEEVRQDYVPEVPVVWYKDLKPQETCCVLCQNS